MSDYYQRYAEVNRRLSRARQRAYRELAKRHPVEFNGLLTAERKSLEADDEVSDPFGRGRPRKESA